MLDRHIQKGLRVLVTAGAAGIGREIVRALVGDGARVHICDIDTAALEDARREHGVTTSVTDVAEVGQVERLFVDLEASPMGDWVDARNGEMRWPEEPGLGVDPDPALIARYRTHTPNIIR